MARPKPCAPPVTTAQRPFRSILFMVKFLSLQFGLRACRGGNPLPRPALRGERAGVSGSSLGEYRERVEHCALPLTRKRSCAKFPTSPRKKRGDVKKARAQSQRPAAIDDVGDAGRERALVAGEIEGERGDLF